MEADYDRILHQLRPMEPRLWPAAPRQTPPHLSRLISASWNELERAGQIRPNRVVSLKRGKKKR